MIEELPFALSRSESKIYLYLLKQGPCIVTDISKSTGLNRTYIYDRIRNLVKLGLTAPVIKDGKQYFAAVDPKRLLLMLKEEQQKLSKKEEELKAMMPELEKLKQTEKTQIQVLKGKEGLKTVLETIIDEGKDVYFLGFTGTVKKLLPYYYPRYHSLRMKKRIRRFAIANYGADIKIDSLTKVKKMPKGADSPGSTWIFGDYTAIFLRDDESNTILIKSSKVAKQYMTYFKILWKQL